jgi:hypothetical protein
MEARSVAGRGGKDAFMQRVAWILGLFAMAPPVLAAELFRCIDPAGGVTWQDAPCGAGTRLTKTLEVPRAAESDDATGPSATAKGAKSRRGESSGRSNRSSTGIAGAGKPNAAKRDSRARQRENCKTARAERDRKLEALGLTRTFEQLRALDDKVRAVCRDL